VRRGSVVSNERTNIYAVADRAGVSIATVSRVQRGLGPVSAETRQRVLEAIEELRYMPNGSGRALAQQRQGAMGIVFPDLAGPYYSEVILGVEGAMVVAGQALLILGTHGREQCADLVLDLMSRVDGLIVMGRTISDEVVRALEGGHVPLVLLARPPVDHVPAVRAENVGQATALTEHLLEHGHERIAFVGDPTSSSDAEERWRGFAQALDDAGAPGLGAPFASAFSETAGREAAHDALDSGATALLCASDEIALGAYTAARARGLRIPEDISITGWDDIQLARFVSPALTTVRQPMRELGATAARLLFDRFAGDLPDSAVLPSDVVVRASCGCEPHSESQEEVR
jgi:LacI family transcriptional regulator